MLALELKYYREAMHFQEVMLRMEDKSYADEFAVAYSHLMEIAGDDSTYGVNVTIGDSGVWDMQLLKRNFYLDAVDGELQDFRLLCGNTQAKLAAEPLLSYSMPAEQTLCNVQVSGTSGTRFVLVQF